MSTTRDCLFEILQKSVFGTTVREDFSHRTFSERELEALYRLAKDHDLAHFVGYALQKNESVKGNPWAQKAEKEMLLAIFRREKQDYEYGRICNLLEENKISYLPLKGAFLRTLYPESWMRTSSDIDILVKETDLRKAAELLESRFSYREEEHMIVHDLSLFSPSGVHLELHFSLKEGVEPMDRVLGSVWEYAVPIEEGKYEHCLRDEFFLFHQISHAAYHFLRGGCGIRPFLDLSLLQKNGYWEKEKVLSLCKTAQLSDFCRGAEKLTEFWFGNGEGDALTTEMEQYLLGGGVFGNMENRVAMGQGKAQGKGNYLLRRVFMPYESLCRYYPSLKKHPTLYPFYQVRRWFRIVFSSQRDFAAKELKQNAALNRDKAYEVASLREKLGL